MHADDTPVDSGQAVRSKGPGIAAVAWAQWHRLRTTKFGHRHTWLIFLTYVLVLSSPVSIFVITGATILLFAVALWNRTRERPPEALSRC